MQNPTGLARKAHNAYVVWGIGEGSRDKFLDVHASLYLVLSVCLSACLPVCLFQLASGEVSLTILMSNIVGEYHEVFFNYPGTKKEQCHTQTVREINACIEKNTTQITMK